MNHLPVFDAKLSIISYLYCTAVCLLYTVAGFVLVTLLFSNRWLKKPGVAHTSLMDFTTAILL
jgi:hypothetical protein